MAAPLHAGVALGREADEPLFHYKLTTTAPVEVIAVQAFVKKAAVRHFHRDGATSICLFASRMQPGNPGMNRRCRFSGASTRGKSSSRRRRGRTTARLG